MKDIRTGLLSDPTGYFALRIDTYLLLVQRSIFTSWVKMKMSLRRIRYGKGIAFYGNAIIRRFPGSSVIIGNNCRFRSSFASNAVGLNRKCFISTLEPGAVLQIGDNSGFSATVIGCAESVTIGRNVICGGNTFITDYDWHAIDRSDPKAKALSSPVVIEDNVWLGLNAVVLKGVTIGKGSIIGANSVVTKSIPAGVIAAGNPCRVVKELSS
jgi:acetyltransferase-like isoleucine patch superfamily enzyme